MGLEELPPAPVAHGHGMLRGPHDVREQDRGENSPELCFLVGDLCEEGLNLGDDGIPVPGPREVVRAGELHEPRAGDVVREKSPLLECNDPVSFGMEDKGGNVN